MKLFFDTSSIVRLALEEKNFEKVKQKFALIETRQATGIISAVTLTELIYVIGKKDEEKAFNLIAFIEESGLQIISPLEKIFLDAGNLKLKHLRKNISLADSLIIATAIYEKADEIITGDKDWLEINEIKQKIVLV